MKTKIGTINIKAMQPEEKDRIIEFYVPQAIAIVDWFAENFPDKYYTEQTISKMVISTLEEQRELIINLQAAKA